jgi:6-phosphogluconolactonase
MTSMIWLYNDFNALSNAAAGILVQQARQAMQAKGWFAVALSGGQTPQRAYELVAQPPYRDSVSWRQVHVFWGDERCVSHGDLRSNTRMARQALLDQVPIPASQIHPISCGPAARQGADEYEAVLREFFGNQPPRFDLIFLGLGENGHTASLFPGSPVLEEKERWVSDVHVAGQDLHRVTLTAPIINQAAVVAFLVSGVSKAGVLKEVLEGPVDPMRLPAQSIRPANGELHWLVDRDAGALLERQV